MFHVFAGHPRYNDRDGIDGVTYGHVGSVPDRSTRSTACHGL